MRKSLSIIVLSAVGLTAGPTRTALAQGCEPIRFTTPVNLGGQGEAYQSGKQWRVTLAYRRLLSNQWFIGNESSPTRAPGGEPPVFKINTVIADVAYSFSDRFLARVSVPFSSGSFSRKWPDQQFHEQTASGIGDITVQGEYWLANPKSHERGNVGIGLGLKAPTGSHTRPSQFYTATTAIAFPADQTIQPGDGGWGIQAQIQAFQRLGERFSVYGFGSYLANPKGKSDVHFNPTSPILWAVPDVYSARAGAAFNLAPDQGVALSLGGRLDGIPVKDLFGGGDSGTIKRASWILYADPGLSVARGRTNFTLSVPVRMALNRKKSLLEQSDPTQLNAGGFAKVLIFAGVSRRF